MLRMQSTPQSRLAAVPVEVTVSTPTAQALPPRSQLGTGAANGDADVERGGEITAALQPDRAAARRAEVVGICRQQPSPDGQRLGHLATTLQEHREPVRGRSGPGDHAV